VYEKKGSLKVGVKRFDYVRTVNIMVGSCHMLTRRPDSRLTYKAHGRSRKVNRPVNDSRGKNEIPVRCHILIRRILLLLCFSMSQAIEPLGLITEVVRKTI